MPGSAGLSVADEADIGDARQFFCFGRIGAREGEMMGIRSIILAVLLLTADVAHAEMGSTFIIGVGQYSCGKLIAAIGRAPPGSHEEMNTPKGIFIDEHTQHQEWLTGFVSGTTSRTPRPATSNRSRSEGSTKPGWICGCATGATNTRRKRSFKPPPLSSTRC